MAINTDDDLNMTRENLMALAVVAAIVMACGWLMVTLI